MLGPAGGPWVLRAPQGTQASALQGKGGKEDVHLDQEDGDGALAPELHLHIQGKVPRLAHRPLQVEDACVGIEPARAEVALFVAPGDGQGDGVPCEGGHRTDAEDVCWHQEAGLEVELVVRDARGRVLALQEVVARGALTLPVGCRGVVSRPEALHPAIQRPPTLTTTTADRADAGSRAS